MKVRGRESAFIILEVNSLDNRSDISRKNIFFSYLNINSVWNKYKKMPSLISENVDIFIVAKTKLDSSFPTTQFIIPGLHHPFQLDIIR